MPKERSLDPEVYLCISHYATEECLTVPKNLDEFARKHLFGKFELMDSGLLARRGFISGVVIDVGLELTDKSNKKIGELPISPRLEPIGKRRVVLELDSFFRGYLLSPKIKLLSDYSMTIHDERTDVVGHLADLVRDYVEMQR